MEAHGIVYFFKKKKTALSFVLYYYALWNI